MKIILSVQEVEVAISSYLTQKLSTGYNGWKLTTPDHVDGYLEFKEKASPPPLEKIKK